MLMLFRAGSLAFITIYIYAITFALAAPVSLKTSTSDLVPVHDYSPLSLALRNIPESPPHVIRSELQTLVRRKSVAQKIKQAFQTVGKGLKKAANWIKAEVPKVIKFGTKVLATVGSVVSKAINVVVPSIGKVISAPIKAATAGLNFVSNTIHSNLGHKLDAASKVMTEIQNPFHNGPLDVVSKVLTKREEGEWVL